MSTMFIGSIQYEPSSEMIESEKSILENFKMISVLSFTRTQVYLLQGFQFEF